MTVSETEYATMAPLGDSAVIVRFGQEISLPIHHRIQAFTYRLQHNPFAGMIEFVPAFTTVTVYYDPMEATYLKVCSHLQASLAGSADEAGAGHRTVEIPVCYGGDFGPDLEFVARHNGITDEEVIRIHSGAAYLVYMIGFAPGFAYMGGMSGKIAAPRKPTPRLSIPPGSVGIAGGQTGIYPISTPGGWQLIGRTPLQLFRPEDNPPSLLQAGDSIRFRPISLQEYETWKGGAS